MRKPLVWHDCYEANWRRLITPEAFAHPAKFARALLERIIEHGRKQGWWQPGDLIGDPFGGVALGGIIAGYHHLNWIGVELEPKFAEAGRANIELHRRKWKAMQSPVNIELVQGDSRQFAEIVKRAGAVITSPPYADCQRSDRTQELRDQRRGYRQGKGCFRTSECYGKSPGQIGKLRSGDIHAVLTSPPYEGTDVGTKDSRNGQKRLKQIEAAVARGEKVSDEFLRMMRRGINPNSNLNIAGYGSSEGQIGKEAGETYWAAMDQVYRQCFVALRPGGVMVVVVKDYVKDRQRVPLCDQTLQLLQHVGFEPVERIHAMLTKEIRTPALFGGAHVERRERKSFFRRLHEKKPGAVKIDWEEVIVVRKPQISK